MTYPTRSVVLPATLALLALVACDGSSDSTAGANRDSLQPRLVSVDVGRLVDIYAYRRIDRSDNRRGNRFNRQLVRIASLENSVVRANLDLRPLIDSIGGVDPQANFEIRPFSAAVGHEELVILWDDRPDVDEEEARRFQAAVDIATSGLASLSSAYRDQNTLSRPIPVVPRNAALRLRFSGAIRQDEQFFRENPSSVQVLEFKGDPKQVQPVDAFRVLPIRVIPKGVDIILDTTILGGEAQGGIASPGLPASEDSITANIRIAIPTRGTVARTFYVQADESEKQNDVDSAGRVSVIRDFRSGNLADGLAGRLTELEPPRLVASLGMGITAVDPATGTVTLNKRDNFVPVRARYPFVDGPLAGDGIPLGSSSVPTERALRSGDILVQAFEVAVPQADGTNAVEIVELRAEVLENLAVGSRIGQAAPLERLGRTDSTSGGTTQGERVGTIQVRVGSVFAGQDSSGALHSFRAAPNQGADCVLRAHYCEDISFLGDTASVSDRAWRNRFVRIDPAPAAGGEIDPLATLAVEFTKPMDFDQVDNTSNLIVTSVHGAVESYTEQMSDPKFATARLVPTRLADATGDGTLLRLQPPMGLFHIQGNAEPYSLHIQLGSRGVTDLAGNVLEISDASGAPADSWFLDFTVRPSANTNLVGWHTWRFESADEDGSLPGSVDMFGQFRLVDGRLFAAESVRFSRDADSQHLGTISRTNRGECWDNGGDLFPATIGPPPSGTTPVATYLPPARRAHPGLLYWQPKMFSRIDPPFVPQVYEYYQQVSQNVGRVVEPHKAQGSRMQMRYLEDDFALDYRQPSEFGLDVEQLYWSPFNNETVYYDVFDRYSMALSHSRKRTDIRVFVNPGNPGPPPVDPFCQWDCRVNNSALSAVFADNVLPGTSQVSVFEDKVYRVNPNEAFQSSQSVKYVPYPKFDRSYTWRDSRLVTIGADGQVAGLGGAVAPDAPLPTGDVTANIDSPWVTSGLVSNAQNQPVLDPVNFIPFSNLGGSTWVMDDADFRGERRQDHDPIALPLLVDFKVFADSPSNGLATSLNSFQVAMLGPPSEVPLGNPGGYYDSWPAGCQDTPAWPWVRVHASGGEAILSGNSVLIDPANTLEAQKSFVKDAGLGNPARAVFLAPEGDGMLNWARADFVRKVSTVTFGFIDTLKPQFQHVVSYNAAGVPTVANAPTPGFPNLEAVNANLRVADFVTQIDPPQLRQPAGTTVVLEVRGAEGFANSNRLYNPAFNNTTPAITADDRFDVRGNLLNPNYACEAFRYSTANSGSGGNAARIAATGLTAYVADNDVGGIRNQAGLLPRFLNVRLVMTNNVDVSPALSPSLRSMFMVYRMQPQN